MMKRKVLIVLGILLFFWCFLPVFAGIFNIGSLTGMMVGALLVLYGAAPAAVHVSTMAITDCYKVDRSCHCGADRFKYCGDGLCHPSAGGRGRYGHRSWL